MKSTRIAIDVLTPQSESRALDTLLLGKIMIAEPLAILLLLLPGDWTQLGRNQHQRLTPLESSSGCSCVGRPSNHCLIHPLHFER